MVYPWYDALQHFKTDDLQITFVCIITQVTASRHFQIRWLLSVMQVMKCSSNFSIFCLRSTANKQVRCIVIQRTSRILSRSELFSSHVLHVSKISRIFLHQLRLLIVLLSTMNSYQKSKNDAIHVLRFFFFVPSPFRLLLGLKFYA